MSEQNQDNVAELVDAGVPADQGLSSLGLIMQLAGTVFAAYAALLTFMMLVGTRSSSALWIFLLLGLSIARSMLHRAAGTQLLYGERNSGQGSRIAGIRRYLGFAFVQTAVSGILLGTRLHEPGSAVAGIVLALAAWPIALAVILSFPRFKKFRTDLPVAEDKGFEGASILMIVLGVCGVVAAGTLLLMLLDIPGKELQHGPGVLIVLAVGMLLVRSVIHTQAGLSGIRETSIDRSVELANRYANFGVISSFCAGGALLLFAMSSEMSVAGLALVSAVCWMLMAWPLTIRKFYSDRQFADLLAGEEAPLHRRAPDAGLTSLGWLLVAHAVFTMSFLLPPLLMGSGHRVGHGGLEGMLTIGGALGIRTAWWTVGVTVLQLWAGYELVRMSPQSQVIATVFGVVGVAVTGYVNWPLIQEIRHVHGFVRLDETIMIAPLALALVIPVATILLVNRKISPTARARFRWPQGETT